MHPYVYALGSNGSGQLALGHLDDVSIPTPVNISATRNDTITSIKAGGNHTLILTKSGNVYTAGSNTDGRCGLKIQEAELTSLVHINPFSNHQIKFVAATWEASIFVTAEASVFVCGSGAKGELGLGTDVVHTTSPQQIPNFPPSGTHIVDLAACMGHVVVVLSNGDVYGWGNGLHGQLGQPAGLVWQPRKIFGIPFLVQRTVCGKDFTCVFGDPVEGRLQLIGLAKRDRFNVKASTPASIPGYLDVQATWGGVYALTASGELIAWGRNDHGQLPPPDLLPLKSIAAGSEHVLVLTESYKVLAWGWGEHGNCSLPTDERSDVKGRWNELDTTGRANFIGCGCATSWISTI